MESKSINGPNSSVWSRVGGCGPLDPGSNPGSGPYPAVQILKAPEPMKIIERLVRDTLDPKRVAVYENLLDGKEKLTKEIANEVNLNRKTVKGILMILKAVGLVDNRMETDDYRPSYTKYFWFNPHVLDD